MNARVLPPEEWYRLDGTEAGKVWPYINPENARVLVVEEDGEIVGTWMALRVVHVECIWVAEKHRGGFGVWKRLLRGMRGIATAWGAKTVITGANSQEVADLIMKSGGAPTPTQLFILPVESRLAGGNQEEATDRLLGRSFHRQIETQVAGSHPDDDAHDVQVGRALKRAIRDHEPEQAMDEYNAWARGAGYEPVTYLGTVDGRMRADIRTAVIEVDERYQVHVVA